MNNPINYWDPTGHVAAAMDGDVLALPDGFNQIPSWVRANDSHTVQDPENENLYTVWTSLGSPSFEQGPTEMTNSVQYAKYYLQTYQRDVTTTWYYQYEKYRIVQDIPRSYEKSDPQKFQELVTYEWEEMLSAEEVAKQSQAEIAKYGVPPYARIVSRQATLPQQYDRWLRNELDRQFKRIEPTAPRTYSVHDGEPEFTYESMRRVIGHGPIKTGGFTIDEKSINSIQNLLDYVGLAPFIGEPADGINAVIYLARGDNTNAVLSVVSVIPGLGVFSTGGKQLKKWSDTADIIEDATPSNVVKEQNLLLKLDLQYFSAKGTGNGAKIGDSFGKAGTLVENPGTKIEWSKVSSHALERMNERGVTKEMAESWVKNGKALSQNNGSKYLFFSEEGAAVVAKDGTLVTVIPKNKFDDAYKALSQSLFGK